MKDIPTSGPIPRSKTHHAFDTISSRHSFCNSQKNADLREGKEHLAKVCKLPRPGLRPRQSRKLANGAFAPNSPAIKQNEAVAKLGCVRDLMNRKKERSPPFCMRPQS